MQNTFSQSGNDSKWFSKKSFFRIGMWNSRPAPPSWKNHLKFPFWLFEPLPEMIVWSGVALILRWSCFSKPTIILMKGGWVSSSNKIKNNKYGGVDRQWQGWAPREALPYMHISSNSFAYLLTDYTFPLVSLKLFKTLRNARLRGNSIIINGAEKILFGLFNTNV